MLSPMTADPATAQAGHSPAVGEAHHLPSAAPLANPWRTLGAIALVVVVLDQASKAAVVATMALGTTLPIIPTFDLHHTTNRGIAFGIGQNFGDIHLPIAFAVVLVLLAVYRSLVGRAIWMRLALALQVGGAVGNIIDRLRVGAVTEFISFHIDAIGFQFAIFNVADAAITVGSVILVGALLLQRDQ
jgi:signal peptidase II